MDPTVDNSKNIVKNHEIHLIQAAHYVYLYIESEPFLELKHLDPNIRPMKSTHSWKQGIKWYVSNHVAVIGVSDDSSHIFIPNKAVNQLANNRSYKAEKPIWLNYLCCISLFIAVLPAVFPMVELHILLFLL